MVVSLFSQAVKKPNIYGFLLHLWGGLCIIEKHSSNGSLAKW